MRLALPLLILLAVTLALPAPAVAQDDAAVPPRAPWPKFHQNLQNTGLSPFSGPDQPVLKWSFNTRAPVLSSPAVAADGTVYVSAGDRLFALDPSGKLKSQCLTAPVGPSSPAIGPDGTVYLGTDVTRRLLAVPPASTEQADASVALISFRWHFNAGRAIHSSPAVSEDGTVYVGSNDGFIYAISPDGVMKWKHDMHEKILGCPAIARDGTIYVCSSEFSATLCALNPDGTVKWSRAAEAGYEFSPAVAVDGSIVVCSTWGNVTCIDPDGSLRWNHDMEGDDATPCVAPAIGPHGDIYIGAEDKYLYSFSASGTLKWRCKTTGKISCSPAIGADGVAYVGSEDGHLYAVTPDGQVHWKFKTNGPVHSSPAIGRDGVLYFGSDGGYLYAVGP